MDMKKSFLTTLVILLFHIICFHEHAIGLESCYELGYRYGLCATESLNGMPCKPENDIVIPERCKGKEETNSGIKAGAKEIFDKIHKDTGSSKIPSSLNMLTTSLDTLREKLEGKTENEVRQLVGNPDRVEVFEGNNCWIYGKSNTSKDRAIIFDGKRVLTVTFY
jgi:hypothetical protein